MKSVIKKFITYAVRSNAIWALLNATIVRMAEFAKRERAQAAAGHREPVIDVQAALKLMSPDLTVRHGPFRGMKYPQWRSTGGALFPKFLGCYERELHPVLEKICAAEYSEIVDIGCAEGYYAVGLAMRIPTAKVFAYDTDSEGINLCRQMARINNVAERITTDSFCDASTLRSIPFTRKALIISDSEGYEKDLFTEETVLFLAAHELLIETHDFIDIEISSMIRKRFQGTHLITAIQSIDDIAKAHTYNYAELSGYDLATRRLLLAEYRPGQWSGST